VLHKHAPKGLEPKQLTIITPRCPICGALMLPHNITTTILRMLRGETVSGVGHQRVVGTMFEICPPRFAGESEYDRKRMTNHFVSLEVCKDHSSQTVADWCWEHNIEGGIHKQYVSPSDMY